jgi:hypothetical protein
MIEQGGFAGPDKAEQDSDWKFFEHVCLSLPRSEDEDVIGRIAG